MEEVRIKTGNEIMDEVVEKHAREIAVDSLGRLVDELHARAREVTFGPAQEAFREAADILSEKRKEIQRNS